MGTVAETAQGTAGDGAAEQPKMGVFLSYSRKDGEFVARLAEALRAQGFEAAYDASPHASKNPELGIAAEDEWWKQLERMITAADAMVFIVSPDSVASKVCDEEIVYARHMGKRVIAVMRREIDFAKAPPKLAALNVKLRFLDDSEVGFAASLAALIEALELDAAWWREQAWFAEQAKTWKDAEEAKRKDWTLSAAELARAEQWAARRPAKAPAASEAELEFLAASRAHQAELAAEELRRMNLRRRLQIGVLAATLVALVLAIGGGIFVVDRQRSVARSESLMLANVARGQADAAKDGSALRLSLLAARDTYLSPAASEAEALLLRTSAAWRVEREFLAKPGMTDKAAISADGSRLVTWPEYEGDGNLTLWDARSGAVIATLSPSKHTAEAPWPTNVWFAGDVVVARIEDQGFRGDAQLVAWRVTDGKRIWERTVPLLVHDVLVSGASGRMVLAEQQMTGVEGVEGAAAVSVVEMATERVVFTRAGKPESLAISEDGSRLAIWVNDRISVVTVADGVEVNAIKADFGLLEARDAAAAGVSLDSDVVKGMRFSPDGGRLVAWATGHGVQGWGLETPAGAPFLKRGDEELNAVAFSADGERIAMWSDLGAVRVFDVTSADVVEMDMAGADKSYLYTTALPNGGGLVTLSQNDNVLRVWSFENTRSPRLQLSHDAALYSVEVSEDGRRGLTRDQAQVATLWDLESGRRLARLSHDDQMTGVGFASSGHVLSWGKGGVVRVWREEAGTRIGTSAWPLLSRDEATDDVKIGMSDSGLLSRDGKSAIVWGGNMFATADVATGAFVVGDAAGMRLCERLFSTYFSCGLAATSAPGRFAIWDGDHVALTSPGAAKLQVLSSERRQGTVDVSADGNLLLGFGADGAVVWDAATGAVKTHVAKGTEVYGAVFLGDGDRFALRDEQKVIHIFETASGKPIGQTVPLVGLQSWLEGRAVSPDGRWMLSAFGDGTKNMIVRLVDGATPVIFDWMPDQSDLVFSPQADVFLTWGDRVLSLWTIGADGTPVAGKAISTQGSLRGLRFSSDGRMFATLETAGVGLWRTGEAKPFATVRLTMPEGLEFSEDGSRLVVWERGRAIIVETEMGELVFETPRLHMGDFMGVKMATLSPDSRTLLVMSPGAGPRLYDVSATARPASVAALRERVCGAREAAAKAEQVNGVKSSFLRITAGDVAAAPILREREGEDVCAWAPAWYDGVLDAVFGWMK